MKQFHKNIPLKVVGSTFPHVSIARGLNAEQLKLAVKMFENRKIDLKFTCVDFSLRKFDKNKKQYSIVKRYPLLNNKN